MADTIITINTVNVANGTPFAVTLGALPGYEWSSTISGNQGSVVIAEADLVGITTTTVNIELTANQQTLPPYVINIIPSGAGQTYTLSPGAGSTLTSSIGNETFTITPYDADWFYGISIGTGTTIETANSDYYNSGTLVQDNVINATGLPINGETLNVRVSVKPGASAPTEYQMFQLYAYEVTISPSTNQGQINVGPVFGYTEDDFPVSSFAGKTGDYFIVMDAGLVDGVAVDARSVLRYSSDSIGGINTNWYLDILQSAILRSALVVTEEVRVPWVSGNQAKKVRQSVAGSLFTRYYDFDLNPYCIDTSLVTISPFLYPKDTDGNFVWLMRHEGEEIDWTDIIAGYLRPEAHTNIVIVSDNRRWIYRCIAQPEIPTIGDDTAATHPASTEGAAYYALRQFDATGTPTPPVIDEGDPVVDDTLPALTSPAVVSAGVLNDVSGGSQTFSWVANDIIADAWWISLGTAFETSDIYSSGSLVAGTTSHPITGIPVDGSTVYVEFSYEVDAVWYSINYTFTATTAAGIDPDLPAILSPIVLSQGALEDVTGGSHTFTWTANNTTSITNWWLNVGTTFGNVDIHYSGSLVVGTTSAAVTGIPTDGSTIYVEFSWQIGGTWYSINYYCKGVA